MTEAKATSAQMITGNPEAEAAEWVVRLGDPRITPVERRAFDDWIAQGPLYSEAFSFARATWNELGTLATDGLDFGDPAPVGRNWWKAGAAGLAASALTASLIGALLLWSGNPLTAWMSDHVTARGELRSVTLPDGSIVELGPDSALNLDFSDTERRVVLVQGEAYFTAAPKNTDEPRPFSVEAGGLIATALGTQFSVDIKSVGVQVVVTEHSVAVRDFDDAAGQRSVLVNEGEAITYTSDRSLQVAVPIDAEFETAWRQGRLVFDDRPLGEVVEELNRYRNGRIVIRNAALAERRVSGIFEVSDVSNALSRIANDERARLAAGFWEEVR
ncbi:FecR family protein [Pseudomonas sp. GX19020]|uniref:FecR family protein n=1 Tax=Pseudomonas sp. GX19020 TaxID=2942277 RepID=UPI0020199374|nr:FecR family protein [Pseudomonas sp. GX19020]MCL4069403.1 FecR family protein [Pseudomonas sp. GX19020]